jgi:hypothetical protein
MPSKLQEDPLLVIVAEGFLGLQVQIELITRLVPL